MSRFESLSKTALILVFAAVGLGASQGARAEADRLPTVSFSASGTASAANDLAQATAYAEITGGQPRDVAAQVNEQVAAALALAKSYPSVRTRTGATNTWPVYAKDSRTISAWRMRSSITLESNDIPALSELVGKLQDRLAVESLVLMPSPDTRAAAEDAATKNALAAFEARARLVSETLKKHYRIKELNIGGHNVGFPVVAAMRGAAMEMKPAPIQAGNSDISIEVNGTIELID